MRLKAVKLKNFRAYVEETTIQLTNPCVIIGKNDSGKSTVLDALDHFFNGAKIEKDDLSVTGEDNKLWVTCVFDDLPEELVLDEDHATTLAAEHLLNEQGELEVGVETTGGGKSKPFIRCNHPSANGVADLLTLNNTKLKERADQVGAELAGVNQTINAELRTAIRAKVADLECAETELWLDDSPPGKRIWGNLQTAFPVYALFKSDRASTDQDSEAQDPMKAAIKQAVQDQQAALADVTEEIKVKVQAIAEQTVNKLREMDPELANQLTPKVTNKPWHGLFNVTLTGDDEVPVNKRGSGTRRLILLNFFRAEAEREGEGRNTAVIYAIEEPETSQHPNNQIMLTRAFQELADRDGCQIIITTHTPTLARRFREDQLLFVEKGTPAPSVRNGSEPDVLNEIGRSLGVLPDHNIKVFVGVEGPTDITFFRTLSKKLHDDGEDIPDLGAAEDGGTLMFVPLGGSNLAVWASRIAHLNKPEFYIMDRDVPPPANPRYHDFAQEVAARGATAFTTSKREIENYIHQGLITPDYTNYAGTGADFDDVPSLFAQAVHEQAEGAGSWAAVTPENKKKKESKAKKRLCGEYCGKMTRQLLQQTDADDELIGLMQQIKQVLEA